MGDIVESTASATTRAELGSLASNNDRWLRMMEFSVLVSFAAIAIVNTFVALSSIVGANSVCCR